MVQIRFTAAALIAAAVIAPAVANSVYPDDSISAREFVDDVDQYFTREYDLDAREFDELVERDPFFHKLRKWWAERKARKAAEEAAKANANAQVADKDALIAKEHAAELGGAPLSRDAHAVAMTRREFVDDEELVAREFDEFFQRELEDLIERDPVFGFKNFLHVGKHSGQPSGDISNQNNAREFEEDIEAREYEEDFEARDFEEDIEARDFDEDLEARDFEEELETREPEYDEVFERYFDDLYERELADELEIVERELSDEELAEREIESDLFEREDGEELVAREPFNLKDWWNNLWHPKKKEEKKKEDEKKAATPYTPATTAAAAAETSDNEVRDFEIDELD